jgi:hypothetical protein
MASLNLTQIRGKNFVPAEFGRTRSSWARPSRVGFKVFASESQAEPDLSVTVNGLHMPNPFVIGSGPPGTKVEADGRLSHEAEDTGDSFSQGYAACFESACPTTEQRPLKSSSLCC